MEITPRQYVAYMELVAETIGGQGEYITALDAATGDGDHWLNINIGYQKLMEQAETLQQLPNFKELFTKLARLIMSGMGGTSGALYGSMYLAAAKAVGEVTVLEEALLAEVLSAWAKAVMDRGNARPGQKTMVDALLPAAEAYAAALAEGADSQSALAQMAAAAAKGAEATRDMEASLGRASNQPGKGVGHLDPGAVTMAMQLQCLATYLGDVEE